jgi:hypothetical protein
VALTPGLYRFTATTGGVQRERMLTVRPGAKLRWAVAP